MKFHIPWWVVPPVLLCAIVAYLFLDFVGSKHHKTLDQHFVIGTERQVVVDELTRMGFRLAVIDLQTQKILTRQQGVGGSWSKNKPAELPEVCRDRSCTRIEAFQKDEIVVTLGFFARRYWYDWVFHDEKLVAAYNHSGAWGDL
ncbi:MAG: hypothetical protein AAGJ28_03010 [Pseudomonadota bacterium]